MSKTSTNSVGATKRTGQWLDEDISALLHLLSVKYPVEALNGPHQRNKRIFLSLESDFKKLGRVKDWVQIRNKWKDMKKRFHRHRRGIESGHFWARRWGFYDQMYDLVMNRTKEKRYGQVVVAQSSVCTESHQANPGIQQTIPPPPIECKTEAPSQTDNHFPAAELGILDPASVNNYHTDEGDDDDTTDDEEEDDDADGRKEDEDKDSSPASSRTDSDMSKLISVIKEEGEKNRETTRLAFQNLADTMRECVDRLIASRQNQALDGYKL